MSFSEVIYRGALITKASKAFILLHGRGGTAHGILSLANALNDDNVYIVAPQAHHNSWYPYSFLVEEKLNEPFLTSSIESIKMLIEEISVHIPKDKVFLIGFSQGACLSLEVSSRDAAKYGGIIALTGGLIGDTINEKKYKGNFEGTKVLISNNELDPHIPLLRSEQSKEVMEKLGAEVTLKVYEGSDHSIKQDEIHWIKKNML